MKKVFFTVSKPLSLSLYHTQFTLEVLALGSILKAQQINSLFNSAYINTVLVKEPQLVIDNIFALDALPMLQWLVSHHKFFLQARLQTRNDRTARFLLHPVLLAQASRCADWLIPKYTYALLCPLHNTHVVEDVKLLLQHHLPLLETILAPRTTLCRFKEAVAQLGPLAAAEALREGCLQARDSQEMQTWVELCLPLCPSLSFQEHTQWLNTCRHQHVDIVEVGDRLGVSNPIHQ